MQKNLCWLCKIHENKHYFIPKNLVWQLKIEKIKALFYSKELNSVVMKICKISNAV